MKINMNPSVAGAGMDSQIRKAEAGQPMSKPAKAPESAVQPKSNKEALEKQEAVNEDMLARGIEQANKSLKSSDRVIERAVHDVTHTVMYTIKDTVTNEVIAEFPPKRIQDMIAKMWELAGLFVDEKA